MLLFLSGALCACGPLQSFAGGGPPVPPVEVFPPPTAQAPSLRFAKDIDLAPGAFVAGAPQAFGGFSTGGGRAFLFNEQPDGSYQGTELPAPVLATQLGARFGDAVSNEANGAQALVLVGAPGVDVTPSLLDAGRAYLFREGLGSSTPPEVLMPFVDRSMEEFGAAVRVRGTSAVVGAPAPESSQSNGCVVPFEEVQGTFTQQQGSLLPSGSAPIGSRFGTALAIDGNLLAVGAPGDHSSAGLTTGAVYLYERSAPGAPWIGLPFSAGIVAGSQTLPGDEFGVSVALEGDLLVVGAHFADDVGCTSCLSSGAVYVFRRTGGVGSNFVQTDFLGASDAATAVRFGSSVAIADGRLLVGADGAQGGLGAVYVFEGGPGAYLETEVLGTSPVGPQDGPIQLGSAVAARSTRFVAGAPQIDFNGNADLGGAYVFRVSPLAAEPGSLSLAAGGTQSLFLRAGADLAHDLYLVLLSDIFAPMQVGEGLVLPIQSSPLLSASIQFANVPPFVDTYGALDAAGNGEASLVLPPMPGSALANLTLYSAFIVVDALAGLVSFASNAQPLLLLP